LRKEQI
jgi:hypothetical protein